ncbi:MAG: hypothetical protein Q7S38_01690 [bacterium]|nr:hypothetical protein [bacterium]
MHYKKVFLFFAVAIFLLIIILFFLTQGDKSTNEIVPLPTPTLVQTAPRKITVSGIQVNDFLSSPIKTNSDGDTLFIKNQKYQMVFFKEFNQFLITIDSSPFEETRKEAETKFMSKLGIDKTEACMLDVFVSFPKFAPPDIAGKNFPLSFCPQKE